MVQVLDKDGTVVTSYQNRSEAETYWQASCPDGPPKFDDSVRENEVTVFNSKNEEVGAIRLPRVR